MIKKLFFFFVFSFFHHFHRSIESNQIMSIRFVEIHFRVVVDAIRTADAGDLVGAVEQRRHWHLIEVHEIIIGIKIIGLIVEIEGVVPDGERLGER